MFAQALIDDQTVMRRSYKGSLSLDRPPRPCKGGGARPKSKKCRDPDEEIDKFVVRDREGHTLSSAFETINSDTIDNTVGYRLDREAVLRSDLYRGVVYETVNLGPRHTHSQGRRFMCKTSTPTTVA